MTDLKTTVKELRTIHAHIAAAGLLGEASSQPVVKLIVSKLRKPCKDMARVLDEIDAISRELISVARKIPVDPLMAGLLETQEYLYERWLEEQAFADNEAEKEPK